MSNELNKANFRFSKEYIVLDRIILTLLGIKELGGYMSTVLN